jgi:hypothetical protein
MPRRRLRLPPFRACGASCSAVWIDVRWAVWEGAPGSSRSPSASNQNNRTSQPYCRPAARRRHHLAGVARPPFGEADQQQGEPAQQHVGTDTTPQPVEHRPDLQDGLQVPEGALGLQQVPVARLDVLGISSREPRYPCRSCRPTTIARGPTTKGGAVSITSLPMPTIRRCSSTPTARADQAPVLLSDSPFTYSFAPCVEFRESTGINARSYPV